MRRHAGKHPLNQSFGGNLQAAPVILSPPAKRAIGRRHSAGSGAGGDEDTVTLFPALTVSEETVHQGLDILEQCM